MIKFFTFLVLFNSLQIFRFVQFERICKIDVREKLKVELGSVENTAQIWLPAFSPFPTMFSKGFFLKVVKSRDCVVKS